MGKENVLKLLRERGGDWVSGEELSARLGVSRAAVWKTMDALRRSGCAIESRKSKGYRLLEEPDGLDETAIRAQLGETKRVGGTLSCFASIDSTNAYLKRTAMQGAPDGAVAVADEQTGGRGRRGRRFLSLPGKGVYLSVLLRPQVEPGRLLPLTGFVAVAMCSAVERAAGVRPQIKWTNDLVLNGKKLCGILTELSVEGESGALQYVVVGIGVNVAYTREDFAGELEQIATSLAIETGRKVSRAALAAAMIEELDAMYDALLRGETQPYLDAYRRDCLTIGREVQLLWQDKAERVRAVGVDDELGLMVVRGDGTNDVIRTGEVSVRGLYGYVE